MFCLCNVSRRQTVDERRKSLANEALLIADTVRKSLAPGGQTRGVSFAAPNAGGEGLKEEDEKEGTTVIPGGSWSCPGPVLFPSLTQQHPVSERAVTV